MQTISLISEYSRRFPDPINKEYPINVEHHILLCRANQLSEGIPTDPNPREQKTDKLLYKEVKESLLNDDELTFHLKNKGITIIADSVEFSRDKKKIEIVFNTGDGIVDGAHTYKIIQDNKVDCPDNQYVKLEILTGINKDMIESIAKGLNTAIQVQEMSLANLGHKFDWIKGILKGESYEESIAYKENKDGDYDARDIVAFMTLFNIGIDEFKEKTLGGTRHPKEAYTSKMACLKLYLKHFDSYKKLKPILKDILYLRDIIDYEGRDLYNDKYQGRGGALAFYKSRKRGKYKLTFSNKESKYQMHDGAVMPILGAFRFLVTTGANGDFNWKTGSFNGVLDIWKKVGADLVYSTKTTSDSRARNPNAIGKDEGHWDNLYKTVALEYLQSTV